MRAYMIKRLCSWVPMCMMWLPLHKCHTITYKANLNKTPTSALQSDDFPSQWDLWHWEEAASFSQSDWQELVAILRQATRSSSSMKVVKKTSSPLLCLFIGKTQYFFFRGQISKTILTETHNCATFTTSADLSNWRDKHLHALMSSFTCVSTFYAIFLHRRVTVFRNN